MQDSYNDFKYDQLKEIGDGEILDNDPEKKDFFEELDKIDQVENNPTGKIESPPTPSGSTGSTENIKNSEISQKKIGDKTVKIKNNPTPKENKKKTNENSISRKDKTYPTPKEKEKKMNEDSIEKKTEAIFQNNVKSSEKNMNLLGHKEHVESSNMFIDIDMIIDRDSDGDMEIENNDYKGRRIGGSDIGSNQNEQEINFSIIATICTNQGVGGEDYKIKDENNPFYNFPEEDGDVLNSLDFSILRQIECNHPHH
jgi:hypothetical protein